MGVPKKDRFNDNWYGIRKREWYGVILRLTQNEVDIVEVSENGTMSAIECKVKEECVSPPQSFVKKYPECRYRVATMGNCFRFFADED